MRNITRHIQTIISFTNHSTIQLQCKRVWPKICHKNIDFDGVAATFILYISIFVPCYVRFYLFEAQSLGEHRK